MPNTPATTLIRPMTPADLSLGMDLKSEAGWNQTFEDWQRFAALSPNGCFVAEHAGQGVGTVAAFTFGPIAWIAMVLVARSMRGKGIGMALMTHALQHLDQQGVASVRLDATPLGRPLYEKLGFTAQFELTRFDGVVEGGPCIQPPGQGVIIQPAAARDLPRVIALDQAATATPRGELIEQLFAQQPSFFHIASDQQQVVGYAASRPGALAAQIGPIIAQHPAAGAALLRHALGQYAKQRVFVDIPCQHEQACTIARQAGLLPQRNLTRMTRGVAVLEQGEQLWAGSGPEKG